MSPQTTDRSDSIALPAFSPRMHLHQPKFSILSLGHALGGLVIARGNAVVSDDP